MYHTINLLAQNLPLLILALLIFNIIMWIQPGPGVTFAGCSKGLLDYVIVYVGTISDDLELLTNFLELLTNFGSSPILANIDKLFKNHSF